MRIHWRVESCIKFGDQNYKDKPGRGYTPIMAERVHGMQIWLKKLGNWHIQNRPYGPWKVHQGPELFVG